MARHLVKWPRFRSSEIAGEVAFRNPTVVPSEATEGSGLAGRNLSSSSCAKENIKAAHVLFRRVNRQPAHHRAQDFGVHVLAWVDLAQVFRKHNKVRELPGP